MRAAITFGLATFLTGLFLGRCRTRRRHAKGLHDETKRLQDVIDFADTYIEPTAPRGTPDQHPEHDPTTTSPDGSSGEVLNAAIKLSGLRLSRR